MLACAAALLIALTVGVERAPAATSGATLVGAGDIATCSREAKDEETARIVRGVSGTVFTLGDNIQSTGTPASYNNSYDPSWGKFKDRTRPSLGNHDYYDTNSTATPYFKYFGNRAGPRGKGYYSYNRNGWHIVVLNSNCEQVGGCGNNSPQLEWLRRDLNNNPARCTMAYWHEPLYASGTQVQTEAVRPFWNVLYDRGAEVVLNGHAHRYERLAPQTPSGQRSSDGIREFIVGTGGMPPSGPAGASDDNSQVLNEKTPGVLRLTLKDNSYSWRFLRVKGKSFTDSGSGTCHGAP